MRKKIEKKNFLLEISLSSDPPGPLDPADRVVGDGGQVAPEDKVSSQCKVGLRVLAGTNVIKDLNHVLLYMNSGYKVSLYYPNMRFYIHF